MSEENKKLDFFKPEDFPNLLGLRDQAADDANEKLRKLVESWPIVFSRANDNTSAWWSQDPGRDINVKARLAFIEKIKCYHEPVIVKFQNVHEYSTICKNCSSEIKATWSLK